MKIRCQQFGQKKSTFSNTFIKLFYAKPSTFPDQWVIAISVERDEVTFN